MGPVHTEFCPITLALIGTLTSEQLDMSPQINQPFKPNTQLSTKISVCVCERERERERESNYPKQWETRLEAWEMGRMFQVLGRQ